MLCSFHTEHVCVVHWLEVMSIVVTVILFNLSKREQNWRKKGRDLFYVSYESKINCSVVWSQQIPIQLVFWEGHEHRVASMVPSFQLLCDVQLISVLCIPELKMPLKFWSMFLNWEKRNLELQILISTMRRKGWPSYWKKQANLATKRQSHLRTLSIPVLKRQRRRPQGSGPPLGLEVDCVNWNAFSVT